MPKEIDSSDVRFLIGETDSMSSSPDIDYKVYGNIITGKIDRTLEYGEKLLIELASKGYLKIEQFGEPDFTKQKDSFRIFKLKEYDGNNENEKNY